MVLYSFREEALGIFFARVAVYQQVIFIYRWVALRRFERNLGLLRILQVAAGKDG